MKRTSLPRTVPSEKCDCTCHGRWEIPAVNPNYCRQCDPAFPGSCKS